MGLIAHPRVPVEAHQSELGPIGSQQRHQLAQPGGLLALSRAHAELRRRLALGRGPRDLGGKDRLAAVTVAVHDGPDALEDSDHTGRLGGVRVNRDYVE